eukprot:COSAG02_NODE_35223_length_471_cov_14.911290_1_plen_56_part_10
MLCPVSREDLTYHFGGLTPPRAVLLLLFHLRSPHPRISRSDFRIHLFAGPLPIASL